MSVLTDFNSAIDSVALKVTGTNSIYDKTLVKLNELYTSFGMSADLKAKAIAEVSAQLAVSTTNKAIDAAVELAKSDPLVTAQVAEYNARIALINNQAATELKKALDVVSQTSVRDAQSAKDLLVKDAQIADANSSTSVRNAQSVQDLLNKAAQKILIDNQAATELQKAQDVIKAAALKTAQIDLVGSQSATESQKATQIARQTVGFSDKLKVEAMKAMGGVASMEAVNSGVTAGTLTSLNARIDAVVAAAV